ncbi:MFS transporter [Cellulomonas sp. P22]
MNQSSTASRTLAAYRALPALSGRPYLPVAFLARVPFSMTTLGVMVLVTATTGSVAAGGLATAGASLGTAAFASVQGNLADRLGQRPVLVVASLLNAVAAVAVVLAATGGAPRAVLAACCFLLGASAPQVGALARVRWIALGGADQPRTAEAAMSYESTVDEITFVLGPALVGVIATAGSPAAALLVAAGLVAVFGLAFALHPTADAPARRPRAGRSSGARRPGALHVLRRVALPVVGMACIGVFFGGTQASVTAVAEAAGRPGVAGLMYAVLGVGSAMTALALVALPASVGSRTRWLTGGTGLALTMSLALLTSGTGQVVAVLAVAGLFVGPTLVTLFSVGGNLVPVTEAGTAMTMLVSANVVGVAAGAAVAGVASEHLGTPTVFVVPIAAAVLVALAGLLSPRERPGATSRTDLVDAAV